MKSLHRRTGTMLEHLYRGNVEESMPEHKKAKQNGLEAAHALRSELLLKLIQCTKGLAMGGVVGGVWSLILDVRGV